jgi:hypothetical protein
MPIRSGSEGTVSEVAVAVGRRAYPEVDVARQPRGDAPHEIEVRRRRALSVAEDVCELGQLGRLVVEGEHEVPDPRALAQQGRERHDAILARRIGEDERGRAVGDRVDRHPRIEPFAGPCPRGGLELGVDDRTLRRAGRVPRPRFPGVDPQRVEARVPAERDVVADARIGELARELHHAHGDRRHRRRVLGPYPVDRDASERQRG